jgi:hypothetical protein
MEEPKTLGANTESLQSLCCPAENCAVLCCVCQRQCVEEEMHGGMVFDLEDHSGNDKPEPCVLSLRSNLYRREGSIMYLHWPNDPLP